MPCEAEKPRDAAPPASRRLPEGCRLRPGRQALAGRRLVDTECVVQVPLAMRAPGRNRFAWRGTQSGGSEGRVRRATLAGPWSPSRARCWLRCGFGASPASGARGGTRFLTSWLGKGRGPERSRDLRSPHLGRSTQRLERRLSPLPTAAHGLASWQLSGHTNTRSRLGLGHLDPSRPSGRDRDGGVWAGALLQKSRWAQPLRLQTAEK